MMFTKHKRQTEDRRSGTKFTDWKKYLAGNLKREKERTIARYLESFLSHVRDAQDRISQQNDSGDEDNVTKENARVSESTDKKVVDANVQVPNKLENVEKSVSIGLAALDRPGTSTSPEFSEKRSSNPSGKSGRGRAKNIETKATQMRQTSSVQRLQGDDDIDDDSPLVDDTDGRQKYILVGWDKFRSKLMMILLVLFILWAVIYFPLIGT